MLKFLFKMYAGRERTFLLLYLTPDGAIEGNFNNRLEVELSTLL